MLSLRPTAIAQTTIHNTEECIAPSATEQFVWSELETSPWEGLHFRSSR